ncbi:hypothetical protein L1987_43573 [Smallanthus sonchifolius]|uniref:Uncharacterized protein n=1 Tax=Smallanthus sonchifolius TaxID=185202 RepID=A0ACB9GM02_9ASTR|nr:hypothetical protein L1987_43573 [Smallanthus sonchifolius]
MIGRALTSVFWGVVADRYGRKPVILLGTSTVFVTTSTLIILAIMFHKTLIVLIKLVVFIFFRVIFNTLFGFSINYWMAITTRFLLGFLNGLLGPIKAYACELFPDRYQALGLSSPAEKFQSLVSPDSLFGRRCGEGDVNGAVSGFMSPQFCNIAETLHFHKTNELESASDAEEKTDEKKDSSLISLLKNWPLMSSIIFYCIFSLWAESPKSLGGLDYSTEDVGTVLSITESKVLSIPLLIAYPYIALLSGFMLTLTLNAASIVKNVLSDQHQRGAANGIAMTLQSICKAIGPACGGAL